MLDTARRVMETDFAGCRGPEDLHIAAAFTGTREEAQEWLEELEAAMAGLPLDAQLAEALAPLHVEHYMSGITAEELARLLRG